MMLNKYLFYKLLVLIISLNLLSACNNDTAGDSQVKQTQVVAKVNGDEISVHQINQRLSRLGALDDEKTKKASRQILNRLIDMQLLQQKAIEAKLDRDPQVLQAIQASKTEILAQAYMQRNMLKGQQPSKNDVVNFYQEHPELFAERRVFNLQELAIEKGREKLQEVEQAVNDKSSISEVAEWLKVGGYKFSLNANVRAAEQLPSKLLAELKTKKDGDMITVVNGESVNVLSIAASEEQSISLDKATPIIEKYFQNKNRKESLKKQMAMIKDKATIEYVGEFSDMANAETEVTKTSDEGLNTEAITDATNQPKSDESTLEKGLAGF